MFARYFLRRFKSVIKERIRVRPYPHGQGAGEQFVRREYPNEVKALRSRSHLKVCLVVIVDADVETVESRLRGFDEALSSVKEESRRPDERVALFIPKRNIETWIQFVFGETPDENTSYPHLDRQSACKNSVEELADRCLKNVALPDHSPPSLKTACKELQRIL